MNPVKPTRHNDDAMPREVATELLAEPKAKMTNTFRKQCRAARDRVYASAVPLVSVVSDLETGETEYHVFDTPAKPTPPATKLHSKSLVQVDRWLGRTIARRAVVQKKYVALQAEHESHEGKIADGDKVEQKKQILRALALVALARQASALDLAREAFEDELDRRRVNDTAHKPHIDPAVRRRAALLAAVEREQAFKVVASA